MHRVDKSLVSYIAQCAGNCFLLHLYQRGSKFFDQCFSLHITHCLPKSCCPQSPLSCRPAPCLSKCFGRYSLMVCLSGFLPLTWPPYCLVSHFVQCPGLYIGKFLAKCLVLYFASVSARISTIPSALTSATVFLCISGSTCASLSTRAWSSARSPQCLA